MAKIGNTSQSSQIFNWFFTYNNYDISEIEMNFIPILKKISKEFYIQEEIGDKGTKHLQGTVTLLKRKRLSELKKLDNAVHWEPTNNKEASIKYCTKNETRNGKQWIHNINDKRYKFDLKLYDWQEDIIKIINSEPDDRTINWFWEEKGCSGKTTFQKYIFGHYDDVVVLSGKASDMKNGIVEYEKKNNSLPKIVLINIPRSSQDFISYTGIEEIKDMFFYSGKYEGGMVSGKSPHVLIFANEEPKYHKLSEDRWNITEIN